MFFTPFALPIALFANFLTVAVVAGGIYLVWAWLAGALVGTVYIVAGIVMLASTLMGRWLVLAFRRSGNDEPRMERGGRATTVEGVDGSKIHVESYGSEDAPPLVLIHGWGVNSTAWYYAKRELASQFRLIVWDLPGLGKSTRPMNNDYDLANLARDLDAILSVAGNRPALLVGHSIGGMIALTFCRLFPMQLGPRVAGVALVDSTYTNPVETTTAAPFFRAIQRPIVEPILHLITWLAPLAWLLNWLGYLNGTTHLVAMLTGFGGHETRGQLDLAARYSALAWPGVVARGVLAMFRYDARSVLPSLPVPLLALCGHVDRMTIPEASATMAREAPIGTATLLVPAGHMTVFETHAELGARLAEFARTCPGLMRKRRVA